MAKDRDGNPRLLYECSSFVLMYKPHGLATVPLKKQSDNGSREMGKTYDSLLWHAANADPKVLSVHGRNPWEGGALHRLDTATAGIVMFAKDQEFYDFMQQTQKNEMFEKYYTAMTMPNDTLKGLELDKSSAVTTISSYFRPYGVGARQVRPTMDVRRAEPKTIYTTLVKSPGLVPMESDGGFCNDNGNEKDDGEGNSNEMFHCTIAKGFRHQIRAHLAWVGHPIVGDDLYAVAAVSDTDDSNVDSPGQDLALTCVGISFMGKEGDRPMTFMIKGFSSTEFPHTSHFAPWFAKNGYDGIIEL